MFTYRLLKYEKGNEEWTRVPNMLVPLTDKETLDETLDFSVIVVKNVPYGEAFEPLTRFKIECRSDDVLFDTIYRVMAIDTVDQIRFGDNPLYRHEITLIEPTKILEGYICDNLTFTNPLSGPKKSLADVIDRLFDVTPTRFANTAPIFKLDTAIRAKLAAIVAPEFSFTGATLFEALLEIGGYIHAIPRLIPDPDNDRAYDTVTYDFLDTAEEYSYEGIRHNAYREEYSIDQYCDDIDSTIENAIMTNKDDTASVIDPYYDGVSFVRTEEVNIRLTEDNMFIPTNRPIYDIVKVEMWVTNGSNFLSLDITQWILERALYETKNNFVLMNEDLKTNYFYFVQGQKNIYGLSFSIQVLQNRIQAWRTMWERIVDPKAYIPNLENMFFRVTYKTFVNMRVKQQKLNSYGHNNYNDINGQNNRSLVYNQQSNSISTYAYGRNMYGVAQKLGNRGKLVTYKFATINTPFPKVGQLTSDGYVVTTVGKEFRLEWIKVSVELSKDFNRLSSYVGLNSRRRFYEISEKMAVNRYMNVSGYVGIGDTNGTGFNRGGSGYTPSMGSRFVMALCGQKYAIENMNGPIAAIIISSIKDNVPSRYLLAPAVSVIGNSIAINVSTVDNFSIGSNAVADNGKIFVQPVEYPQFDTIKLFAYTNIPGLVPEDLLITRDNAMALPKVTDYIDSHLDQDYKLLESPLINVNKDTRETLNITYQLHFLAKNDNIIVNSNFANFYPLVAGLSGRRCNLVYLSKRLSPFAESVDSSAVVYSKPVSTTMVKNNGDTILIEDTVTQECKAVALCDADNNLLVGINKEQNNGDKSYVSFHFNN